MVCILPVPLCESHLVCQVNKAYTGSIDEGAHRAITRKESGGRLLPAGVVRVEGVFASHQGVRLVVRRRRRPARDQKHTKDNSMSQASDTDTAAETTTATSLASPSLRHLQTPAGNQSSQSSTDETDPEPGTPTIKPAASMSSSVASLEPLSRSVPPSPAIQAISERLSATSVNSSLGQELKAVHETQALQTVKEKERLMDVNDDWEEVEIGKGLSHYNSVEIDRIKGMKR